MDESSSNPNTAEPDEFVPNIHPPTDDEGVRIGKYSSFIQEFSKYIDSKNKV